MQHFKALRTRTWFARTRFAISLILGFVLVTFGCDTSNFVLNKSSQSVNIGKKAEAVPEEINIT